MKQYYISVERAVKDLQNGKMVILQDAGDRENEGDIVFLASKVTTEMVRFTTNTARGLLCVAVSPFKAQKLGLDLMFRENNSPHTTPFTVSIDAKEGTTTGISIRDRFTTIAKMGESDSNGDDFYKPGHIFPLIAAQGGLSEREGHTEGAVELAKLAEEEEAVAICEILGKGDGMASGSELEEFAEKHQLGILRMEDLIGFLNNKTRSQSLNQKNKSLTKKTEPQVLSSLATSYGCFSVYAFPQKKGEPSIALVSGDPKDFDNPLVRIHSECLTGDLLGSLRCDCGEQMNRALRRIGDEGGIFIYLRQEGRGIGLIEKLKAYYLQDRGLDTVDANIALGHGIDEREYSEALRILDYFDIGKDNRIEKIRLITNNPGKIRAVEEEGITVYREAIVIEPGKYNARYLSTKNRRMDHLSAEISVE